MSFVTLGRMMTDIVRQISTKHGLNGPDAIRRKARMVWSETNGVTTRSSARDKAGDDTLNRYNQAMDRRMTTLSFAEYIVTKLAKVEIVSISMTIRNHNGETITYTSSQGE